MTFYIIFNFNKYVCSCLRYQDDYPEEGRQRALTVSEGTKIGNSNQFNISKNLPTVFKWDGGGKEVAICGTFSDWKPIPMAKRLQSLLKLVFVF